VCVYAHKGDEKMRYGRRSRYPGKGPWRDFPPVQRPGWIYGYGRGYGFTSTDPTKCARFPWLSRWWWNNQYTDAQSVSEKEFLEGQVNFLTQELEGLKKKLGEISKEEA
jgi:hypothetical protein